MTSVYVIKWSATAVKNMRGVPPKSNKAIRVAVESLKHPREAKNVVKLRNHVFSYRMRVGSYRVLFDRDDEIKIIAIERVKKRDEHTY